MNHLIVSHFPYTGKFSNGVINYIKSVSAVSDFSCEAIFKKEGESQNAFRSRLARSVIYSYGEDVLIEAAESQASTLSVPMNYNIHIRMHCPFYLYKKIIKEEPDEKRFSEEVRAMYKAKVVSSPSHGMLELLKDELDVDKIHVFKNPIDLNNVDLNDAKKDIDVVFLLRFNRLKGSEYINPILRLIPERYNVYLVGKQEEKFHLDSRVRCRVTILDHVEGDEKYDILKRSKVSISLSKFENCSMVILESLGVGTPVVCWDVGGNSEIAPPSLLKAVDFEDIFMFAEKIIDTVSNYGKELYPSNDEFSKVIESINKDFVDGYRFLENHINDKNNIYKGLTYKSEHDSLEHTPYETRGLSWSSLEARPIKYLALVNTYDVACKIYSFFNCNKKKVKVFCRQSSEQLGVIRNIDWLIKSGEIKTILDQEKPDVILLDDPKFTSDAAKNSFVTSLKWPVLFIRPMLDGFLVDRFGWSRDSYFSCRKIRINSKVTIDRNVSDARVLVVSSENSKLSRCALNKIKGLLKDQYGIEYAYVNASMGYSDVYYSAIETDHHSLGMNEITDVIYVDDSICFEHLLVEVNVYSWGDPVFLNNKNIGRIINSHSFKLNEKIIVEGARNKLIDLADEKIIRDSSCLGGVLEESIPVLNRCSYKRHYY